MCSILNHKDVVRCDRSLGRIDGAVTAANPVLFDGQGRISVMTGPNGRRTVSMDDTPTWPLRPLQVDAFTNGLAVDAKDATIGATLPLKRWGVVAVSALLHAWPLLVVAAAAGKYKAVHNP